MLPATGQSRATFDLREKSFILLQAVDKLEAMSDQELLADVLDALKKASMRLLSQPFTVMRLPGGLLATQPICQCCCGGLRRFS